MKRAPWLEVKIGNVRLLTPASKDLHLRPRHLVYAGFPRVLSVDLYTMGENAGVSSADEYPASTVDGNTESCRGA